MIRKEYPRPTFIRKQWLSLNGQWNFAFDDDNIGLKKQWYAKSFPATHLIEVPFGFQAKLSGIHDPSFHDVVFYQRTFKVKPSKNEVVLLHFGAVDFISDVYVNGIHVNHHEGGQTGFSVDITPYLTGKEENLVVRVFDSSTDLYFPRGKQYWKEKSESIWYTRTTGIWQSVWLEVVPLAHVEYIKFTPNYDEGVIELTVYVSEPGHQFLFKIKNIQGEVEQVEQCVLLQKVNHLTYKVFHTLDDYNKKSWRPENPYLFDVEVTYGDDFVQTYFGMRKVSTKNGKILLNNEPYYLKMVLDQGYWPDGLLTAPSINDLKADIEFAKAMGFNGARKHQKVEDPYFAYYADKLGFLIWGEMASAVNFSEQSARYDLIEWESVVKRDYNHPSIIAWVPLNESWGVPEISHDKRQQQHSLDLYNLIKHLDPTRLISNNDGWEITKTDITGIHNYMHGEDFELEKQAQYEMDLSSVSHLLQSRPANRPIYAEGWEYELTPIMLTEFGGISFTNEVSPRGWGYTSANSAEDLLRTYRRIIEVIKKSHALAGYCYTQLSDVEQEINGFLTYERRPKVALEKIKAINDLI